MNIIILFIETAIIGAIGAATWIYFIRPKKVAFIGRIVSNKEVKESERIYELIKEEHFIEAYGDEKGRRWWNLYLVSKANNKSMVKFIDKLIKYEGVETGEKLFNTELFKNTVLRHNQSENIS